MVETYESERFETLDLLLRDMPKGPLLTAEQEWALARRIRGENVLVPPPGNSRPSPKEAHDRLIEQNIRLVISVAKKYLGYGVEIEDLIQEGAMGLHHGAEKFDPDKGFRFSTYAYWWIRQSMTRALADLGRTSRLPVHRHEEVRRYNQYKKVFLQNNGCEPTPIDLIEELGLTLEDIQDFERDSQPITYLSAMVGEDIDEELGNFIADPFDMEKEILDMTTKEIVKISLGSLSPNQRMVLKMRFGIDFDRSYTLEEIGQQMGVSRERVRQLEAKALDRSRQGAGARVLRSLLE